MSSPAAKYRERLPQLAAPMLTDGGLETTLIFHQGMELPDFASFVLLETEEGRRALKEYFAPYAEIARRRGLGLILESATWRANPDWGRKLGYSDARLAELNRAAIDLLPEVSAAHETPRSPMIVSGCLGPRGDGYVPSALMTAEEAQRYHTPQIETFAGSAADMVSALTMNYLDEAIGIARAMERLAVLGGCCGTDHRHVEQLADAWLGRA